MKKQGSDKIKGIFLLEGLLSDGLNKGVKQKVWWLQLVLAVLTASASLLLSDAFFFCFDLNPVSLSRLSSLAGRVHARTVIM